MNLSAVDWSMIAIPVALLLLIAVKTRKYTRSVADFMSASRVAGRYLVATASNEAAFGASQVIGQFEQIFIAGFTWSWWLQANNAVWLFILLSGFIIYRYRESRVMTLAQFFEIRYSKSFRIFAGFLAFLSGLLSYGIYPAVGARFFIYFCGIPDTFHVGGVAVSTFIPLMLLLIAPGLLLTVIGGQLTLMVVDCVEGIISLVFRMAVSIALIAMFKWHDVSQAMLDVPKGHSLFNPFDQGKEGNFNFWFMAIAIFANAYGWQSSQVGHGFRSAAISAHEQKMGAILGPWRNEARTLMLFVVGFCAFCFMHSHAPQYVAGQAHVQSILNQIPNVALRKQVQTSVALGLLFPPVIKGMFAAIMLFAMISADSTMMHSWGTILVQDVIVPLRKTPMETKNHILLLRLSVTGVALFALVFSIFYQPGEAILMFTAVMMGIFAGAGAAIIGGFYWTKGTTAGAWGAMVGGMIVSTTGFVLDKTWTNHGYPWLENNAPGFLRGLKHLLEDVISPHVPQLNWTVVPDHFPINFQWVWFLSIVFSIALYVGLSLLTYKRPFNLDRMLHRGQYAIAGETHVAGTDVPRKFSLKMLIGITPEFTKGDKAISFSLFGYRIAWFIAFVIITAWNISRPWPDSRWVDFWYWTTVVFPFLIGVTVTIWFTWGGIGDLRRLFAALKVVQRNPLDDGMVVHHHNLGEPAVGGAAAARNETSTKIEV